MKLASLLLVNSWIVIETCEMVCETQTDWARTFRHNMQALVQNVVVTKQIGILAGWGLPSGESPVGTPQWGVSHDVLSKIWKGRFCCVVFKE